MVPKVVLSDDFKQPEFTGMVDHGAIGVFDNFFKWDFCDSVIDSFEYCEHVGENLHLGAKKGEIKF